GRRDPGARRRPAGPGRRRARGVRVARWDAARLLVLLRRVRRRVHRRAPRQRDGGRGRDGGGTDRNAVEGRDDRADRDGGGAGGDAQGRRGDVPATRRLTHAPTAQAWSGAPKRSRRGPPTTQAAA